jgi:hypothetical protein
MHTGRDQIGVTVPVPEGGEGRMVSSASLAVEWVSSAPTASTYGSLAGSVSRWLTAFPPLPAETTTTIPARQATSTANASGSTV